MKLFINGETVEIPTTIATITDLLKHFQLDQKVVIVEQNEHILQKEDHPSRSVNDGDRIEIVHFVGGG